MAAKPKERLGGTRGLLPPMPPAARRGAATADGAQLAARAESVEYRKTTVTLALEDMEFLDQLALSIRRRSRMHVNRGEIIRALIAAVRESKVDLSVAPSEAAIKATVMAKLRA